MRIKCFRECYINKKKIKPGNHKLDDIDHKDPVTAMQLRVLKKSKAITFSELLPDPILDVDGWEKPKPEKEIEDGRSVKGSGEADKEPGEVINKDKVRRRVSKQKKNASS